MRYSAICGLVLFFAAASTSNAALIAYTDYASWSSAVTGITPVTIPDVNAFLGYAPASATFSDVTFSTDVAFGDPLMFALSSSFTSTFPIVTVQQGTRGFTVLELTFPTPITAYALNYGTFTRFTLVNMIILSTGDRELLPGTGDGYMAGGFIGIVGTTPFHKVTFASSIAEVFNVGNVAYAHAAPVPEPGTLTLFGLGACGLIGLARRRRHNG